MSRLAAAAVLLLLAAPARSFEIEGAWYVLVHYRDARSALPEQDQWEDRLWIFEREGAELRFREYPVVLFEDEAGRFERRGDEPLRTLGAWQPTPEQSREIADGLRVDPRGAREKRLRPAATGFSSARSAFDSARVVSFESRVDLELSGPAPRLSVSDSLGSSAAHALAGRTEYRGERVTERGAVEGRFERDGTRVGSFTMLRSGAPRGLGERPAPPPPEPTRAEVEGRLYRTLGRQLAASEALPERFEPGGAESRDALRARVRAELDLRFADQGNDPRAHAPTLERLATAIERAYVDDGRSREEIGRMLEDGRLRP